jgi:hypothetical protein
VDPANMKLILFGGEEEESNWSVFRYVKVFNSRRRRINNK